MRIGYTVDVQVGGVGAGGQKAQGGRRHQQLLEEFHEIPHTKIEEMDRSPKKILARGKDSQEAARVCVHYYPLTFRMSRRPLKKKPTAKAVGCESSRRAIPVNEIRR